jgi:hypothetical protein
VEPSSGAGRAARSISLHPPCKTVLGNPAIVRYRTLLFLTTGSYHPALMVLTTSGGGSNLLSARSARLTWRLIKRKGRASIEARLQIYLSQRNSAKTIGNCLDVFPRVTPAAQGLDIRYPVAAAQGQRDDVVRRKRSIVVSASKTDVAVLFAQRLELCGSVVTFAFEAHRPVAISLSGSLRRVLLSPLL